MSRVLAPYLRIKPMSEKANIGVVGQLMAEHPEANFIACESVDDFVASLAKPRTAIIMVQAGAGTDAVISQLAERFEKGDIIVDEYPVARRVH